MKTDFASGTSPRFRYPLQEKCIDFPLRSRGLWLALILVVGIPAAMIGFKVTQIAMAARLAGQAKVTDLQKAIALDPTNAAYYDKLGLLDAYSFDHGNLHDAVNLLRKATELNPHKARYWSDLAQVCDTLGDTACSNSAIQRALKLSPLTPRLEWQAGNHYLVTGHSSKALQCFRQLLAIDATYAQPVFRISMSAVGNLETVYLKVVHSDAGPQLKIAYLDFASSQGDVDFANRVWQQISSKRFSCKFTQIEPYLDRLLSTNDIEQATKVWSALERTGVIAKPENNGRKDLVYDGGFEHGPLNAGFGWHAPNTPYVDTDFRDPSAYQGSRCLRVDYAAGQNLESQPVYQFVPVEPQQAYQLRAYVRSGDITSQSGPRLRVVDPECAACLNVSTAPTVGTTPWHLETLDFATGLKTQVIRLSVWRPRCWTFPMEISGSFWLDDVSIEPLNSIPKEAVSIH